jgi:galactose oxidase-like protein
MASRRWYPTAQLLPDGKAMLSSGSQYHHMIVWGGTSTPGSEAAAQGDLHRLQLTDASDWDPMIPYRPNPPATDWPEKRYGHSLSAVDPYAMAIFGGRNSNGQYLFDEWQLVADAMPMSSDFNYYWHKLHATGTLFPAGRMEHSAFYLYDNNNNNKGLIVYGGRDGSDVFDQVWRRYINDQGQRVWELLPQEPAESGGPLPGERFGQTLAYQYSTEYPVRNRALVFGGADSTSGRLADNDVWELTIELNTPPLQNKAKWRKLVVESGPTPPVARYEHAMTRDPFPQKRTDTSLALWHFYVSGGRFGPGVSLSNEFWQLWDADVYAPFDTVAWGPLFNLSNARAGHSMIYDASAHRLVVMGGDTGEPESDNSIWENESTGLTAWTPVPATNSPRLVGHSAFMAGRVFARKPEKLDPDSDEWQTVEAPLVQDWYPFQFTIANGPRAGKIFNAGPSNTTFLLDLNAESWTQWPEEPSGFKGGSAVLYRPDRVMKCGSRDTESAPTPPPAIGTTKFIALDQATPLWTASSSMQFGRVNHNLTILPSGEVLATGGTQLITDGPNSGSPRRQPELWRPPGGNYPNGVWYGGSGTNSLEPAVAARDYHSTALLLPDGRVLTAGGEHSPENRKAEIYCPPYLFTSGGGPAIRPQITSAPTSITYGQSFVIGKQVSDVIASACLIRPGAVTHGYDQDQRYIPLTFEDTGYSELRALAPTSGRVAPPGDYLLFIVNQSGVPAVAKWVRLGDCPAIPCDTDSPPRVANLYVDVVGPNEILLGWSAPGDDFSPLAGEYDLRYSPGGIASDAEYDGAIEAEAAPAVQPAGSAMGSAVYGLSPCTQYYFALKTRDGGPVKNWSLRSNTATETTMCGCCGGGFSAERVDPSREGGGASTAAVAPSDDAIASGGASNRDAPLASPAAVSSLDPGAGVLEAETRRTGEGGWQVTLRRLAQAEGVDGADAGAIVSQVPDGAGGWKTLGRYRPTPGQSPLGLCALRDRGRVVFPWGYALERVVSGIKAGAEDLTLSLANHSRLGSLSGELVDGGGSVELTLGDALTLNYSTSGAALPGAASWYLLVRPTGSSETSAAPARSALVTKVPARFALHQNQPNPFRRTTTIAFDLPVTSSVKLEVFDLLGRKVATLAEGEHPAGAHTVEYDLRGPGGAPLRAGIYVYRLRTGTFEDQRKLTVLP